MSNLKFKDLTKDDIEVRVQQCGISKKGNKWAKLLIYKDARCDMNLLDETVGVANWQRKHYECKGNLFCEVGIKIGNEWIWKGDAGVPSNAEAVKGEASDSFKRACVNWGIGRELYTAPNISVFGNCLDLELNKNGKGYKCNNTFEVTHLVIENKKIVEIKIASDGNEIYSYPETSYNKPKQAKQAKQTTQTTQTTQATQATSELKSMLLALKSVMDEKGITEEQVKEKFNIKGSLRNLQINTIDGMIKKLKQSK